MKVLTLLLSVAACGSEPPVVPEPTSDELIPLAVGNRWTFRITDSAGIVSEKTQEVLEATMAPDGRPAFVMLTRRALDKGTRSVQLVDEGRLLRASEQTLQGDAVINDYIFEPYGLRIDSSVVTLGATYTDQHDKHQVDGVGTILQTESKAHTFRVEAVDEVVQVPAGDFTCIRVSRQREGSADKIYWYAPGVGKVREIGGQTEELESYSVEQPETSQ